ncbi:Endo-1,4-beta-xylanase A precursor [compost metagenome]
MQFYLSKIKPSLLRLGFGYVNICFCLWQIHVKCINIGGSINREGWNRLKTRKIALLTVIALSLMLPQGLASANTVTVTTNASGSSSQIDAPLYTGDDSITEESENVKFSKDQAIAKIKELVPSLKNAKVEYAQLRENDTYMSKDSFLIWDIQWRNGDSYRDYNGTSTQLNANTGELINLYSSLSSQEDASYYPPKLSREEAKEQAIKFISKVLPSLKITDLHLQDQYWDSSSTALFGPIQYSYFFTLNRNGIPSLDNVSMTIDSNGNITQYSSIAEGLEYPSATPKISKSAAEKKFNNEFNVELYYVPVIKKDVVQEWILGWRPSDESLYAIDAITGKRLNYSGESLSSTKNEKIAVPKSKSVFQPRSENTEMTSKEAVEIIKKVAVIPSDRSLSSQTIGKDYNDSKRKVWRLMWQEDTPNTGQGYPLQTEGVVDAVTGQILDYRIESYGLSEGQESLPAPVKGTVLTKETAKQKAYEFINSLYPDASSKLKLLEFSGEDHYSKESGQYSYQFGLFVNDVPVSNALTSVNFDKYGRLTSYYADRITALDKITLSPVASVTKETALQTYSSLFKLDLKYSYSGGYYNSASSVPEIKLVYEVNTEGQDLYSNVLDANTGKWVKVNDYSVYGNKGIIADAVDLKGHWAEKDLATLIEHKIIELDEESRIDPDKQVTLGEWLTMMVKAVAPYYSSYSSYSYGEDESDKKPIAGVAPDNTYYDVVGFAAERKWIDWNQTLKLEDKLTREQLAVSLASIVNYDKFTSFLNQDASLNQFSDAASIQNRGAVALSLKLGLLQGQNGQINPNGNVTRADAATIIMNLVKLQGKIDQVISQ